MSGNAGASKLDYSSWDREFKFRRIIAEAKGFGLRITEVNQKRKPWGGYVKFHPNDLDDFRKAYWRTALSFHWQHVLRKLWRAAEEEQQRGLPLDAKLLLLEPGERFSLQSHQRREELWRVIDGPVVVVLGESEEDLHDIELRPGEVIRIPQGRLHRAAAPPSSWGVIAEFWYHGDPQRPSNEKDVIRYEDDYDRTLTRRR
jgi:mannose-6-phosphate isomerase-like protein (cupin superfamily)